MQNISSSLYKCFKGFTIITGETGSGKSILLDALALVLGRRADLSALRNPEEKCVVEAEFAIASYGLADFFQHEELDYEPLTIIHREILPSGKSRAFVNDSPITLDVLFSLGKALIDIHSQHDTQQLSEEDFQFSLIDSLAENRSLLEEYQAALKVYSHLGRLIQRSRTGYRISEQWQYGRYGYHSQARNEKT